MLVGIRAKAKVFPVMRIFELVIVPALLGNRTAAVHRLRIQRTILRLRVIEKCCRHAIAIGDLPSQLAERELAVLAYRAHEILADRIGHILFPALLLIRGEEP